MRRLLFVALVIVTVGCVPAPTRMVVVGDSNSVPADAWPSAIDCMDVANRSISGAGLGTAGPKGPSPCCFARSPTMNMGIL